MLIEVDKSFSMFEIAMRYLHEKFAPSNYVHLAYHVIEQKLYFDRIDNVFELFMNGATDEDNKSFLIHALDGVRDIVIENNTDNLKKLIQVVQRLLALSPKHIVMNVWENMSNEHDYDEDVYDYVNSEAINEIYRKIFDKYINKKPIASVLNQIATKRTIILSRLKKNKETGEYFMKQCKNAESLGALDWKGVPEPRRYGPDSDGYCFDIKELEKVIIISFQKGLWPTSPYTRKPFTIYELQNIVNHMINNNIKHSQLLPMILFGITNGYISLKGIHGKKGYAQRVNFYTTIRTYLLSAGNEFTMNENENWH